MSPQTLRNKVENWLDWKRGFRVILSSSEATRMTWSSSVKIPPQGQSKWPVALSRHLSHEVAPGDEAFL